MRYFLFALMFMASSAQAAYTGPLKTVDPIRISNKKDATIIENVHIENPNGDCISISESSNVVIRNSDIGPCKGGTGRGIYIGSSTNTEVSNNVIHDIEQQGISIEKGSRHSVHHNDILRTSTAVYTAGGAGTGTMGGGFDISYNYIDTINGNVDLKGHAVIFNQINGPGSKINCNKVRNDNSTPIRLEDVIDLYSSSGVKGDPIQVNGNRISGGADGINWNGGGIIIADGPGVTEYVEANDNLVIEVGSYGMEIMTGSNITMNNNFIYSRGYKGNYNGIYVSNYYHDACLQNKSVIDVGKLYACACSPITMTGNTIEFWSTRSGKQALVNVNANGACAADYGPITNQSLAANNNLATTAGQFAFPSFDTVRPSCQGDAGANKATNPPPVDPPKQPTVAEQCGAWQAQYNLVPYVSWGSTPNDIQPLWNKNDCNHQVCQFFKDKYGVVPPGTVGASPSMGTLPDALQKIWIHPQVNCNDYLKPKCDDLLDILKKAGSCKAD